MLDLPIRCANGLCTIFAEHSQRDSAIWAPHRTSSNKSSIINPATAPELLVSTTKARMSAKSKRHWRCGPTTSARLPNAAGAVMGKHRWKGELAKPIRPKVIRPQGLAVTDAETVANHRRRRSERAFRPGRYSRLVEADEEGTLSQWKALWGTVIEPKIKEHRGRIARVIGDGILAEFASVIDAVRCAVEVQRSLAERNANAPRDKRIEFRVGINFGELIIEDGDFWGDGVNIVARLEALAHPGGICVSGRVQEDTQGKLEIAFDDMGEQHLKNIARPVRVYRVRFDEVTKSTPALPLPSKPSISVLPFQNMSGDASEDYFADGVVEEITTALSRIRWLFVIARNSSFTYKGRMVDVKQVGRELGVRYALEGSVRKEANRVRVTAQLIDAVTGHHVWAERYDRELAGIFALQDEITERVVAAVEPQLYAAEGMRAKRKQPESLDAWECVVRALSCVNSRSQNDYAMARELLERAIELDPAYAQAHALFAYVMGLE